VRLARHPVAQFLAVSLATIALISVVSGYLANRAAEDEALSEAERTNALLAQSVAQPRLARFLALGDRGAIDDLDRDMTDRLMVHPVVHVNIWDEEGRVLFSSEYQLIGNRYDLSPDQELVLSAGGSGTATTEAGAQQPGPQTKGLVRIYTRFVAGKGDPLLFEGYYSLDEIRDRRAEILDSFRWITLGGPVLLVLW
jgi:hypothetical protein